MQRSLGLFFLGLGLTACTTEATSLSEQHGISPNGISPNGISPNGISPNGISPNGISPNGISPNGVSLNGISPNGISPNGTALTAATGAAPLTGAELAGSRWTGLLSDGSTLPLRIDDAQQLAGANADVWSYAIAFERGGVWRPLCTDANGAPLRAVAVPGTWDLRQGVAGGGSYDPGAAPFTLACRGSAIAKCAELGYKPWLGYSAEITACVRALRGDYCGDGTPYTITGTLVNLYDALGIQDDAVAWDAEAEWTAAGARCVSKKKYARFSQPGAPPKPHCVPTQVKQKADCGLGFDDGATIITEVAP